MIWLKRFLPFLTIGLGVGGYFLWERWYSERRERREQDLARVTAQVWIATARYRHEPERFLQYRDSLLEATGVPREKVLEFIKDYEDTPEELMPFAQKVQKAVDSLFKIEDSIAKVEAQRVEDSLVAAGAKKAEPKPSDMRPGR